MITVINKIKIPQKSKGFLPSQEEIMYKNVIPKYINKIKSVSTGGLPVTVTLNGTTDNFDLAIDSDNPIIIKNIQNSFK